MLGSSFSRRAHSTSTAQLKFEQLDERTVLAAMSPFAEVAANVDANAELDLAPPSGLDGDAFMQGTSYTFSIGDFGFSDPGDFPPDNFTGIRIASLPQQGNLTAFGSGVGVGQVISAQALLAGELRYANAGIEETPYATLRFQVQDDGSIFEASNTDPSPNTFTLFFDDQRVDFVRNLYQDILDRNGETAGITSWLARIVDGSPNSVIVSEMWNVFEHRAFQVDVYYQQFLNRTPDADGRAFWINQMLNGMSEPEVMTAFIATQEYQLNNVSNEAFLAAVYGDLFDRTPDPSGEQFWLDELSSGRMTREMVGDALVHSSERYRRLVFDYYGDYYSRLPDAQGLDFWVDQLTSEALDDRGVGIQLLLTPEYQLQNPGIFV